MVKISRTQYENEILGIGFKCKFNPAKSGKKNKYYYIVDSDYENYLKYAQNKNKKEDK